MWLSLPGRRWGRRKDPLVNTRRSWMEELSSRSFTVTVLYRPDLIFNTQLLGFCLKKMFLFLLKSLFSKVYMENRDRFYGSMWMTVSGPPGGGMRWCLRSFPTQTSPGIRENAEIFWIVSLWSHFAAFGDKIQRFFACKELNAAPDSQGMNSA